MTEQLKPCPFCNSTNVKQGGDDKIVGVWCENCGASGPNGYLTINGDFDWNTRPAPPAVDREAIAEIVEATVEKSCPGFQMGAGARIRKLYAGRIADAILQAIAPAPVRIDIWAQSLCRELRQETYLVPYTVMMKAIQAVGTAPAQQSEEDAALDEMLEFTKEFERPAPDEEQQMQMAIEQDCALDDSDFHPADDTYPVIYLGQRKYIRADIAEAENAALRAQLAAAREVKPIPWGNYFDDPLKAETVAGLYVVEQREGGKWQYRCHLPCFEGYDSPDEAKAAAQADHKRRVLAALVEEKPNEPS